MTEASVDTLAQLAIALPIDAIQAFCQRWQIAELAVLGSILRDDFDANSDVDFLYVLKPNIRWSWRDLLQAEAELAQLLDRKVDLVGKISIEQSRNWLRKRNILSSTKVVYDTTNRGET
ncbi:MAG: DNA polymerase subunit beta [Leptolyngbyaceae cyanobacterium SU_3_3]|nr:DNA polymerase subunit beta [Leptolyngbyaceae cyanobacterium SU_3_3]